MGERTRPQSTHPAPSTPNGPGLPLRQRTMSRVPPSPFHAASCAPPSGRMFPKAGSCFHVPVSVTRCRSFFLPAVRPGRRNGNATGLFQRTPGPGRAPGLSRRMEAPARKAPRNAAERKTTGTAAPHGHGSLGIHEKKTGRGLPHPTDTAKRRATPSRTGQCLPSRTRQRLPS